MDLVVTTVSVKMSDQLSLKGSNKDFSNFPVNLEHLSVRSSTYIELPVAVAVGESGDWPAAESDSTRGRNLVGRPALYGSPALTH